MRFLFLLLIANLLISCTQSKQQKESEPIQQTEDLPENFSQYRDITGLVDADEFYRLIKTCDSVKIYDVRPREVYESEPRIKGGKLIYDFTYFKEALKNLHRDHQLMVYCGKELRSPAAVKALVNMGFNNVYELQGGLAVWKAKKLPLVDQKGKTYEYSIED